MWWRQARLRASATGCRLSAGWLGASASLHGTARLDGTQGRLCGLPAHNRGSVTALRQCRGPRRVGDPLSAASCAPGDLAPKIASRPPFLPIPLPARYGAYCSPHARGATARALIALLSQAAHLVVFQGVVSAWLQGCNHRLQSDHARRSLVKWRNCRKTEAVRSFLLQFCARSQPCPSPKVWRSPDPVGLAGLANRWGRSQCGRVASGPVSRRTSTWLPPSSDAGRAQPSHAA